MNPNYSDKTVAELKALIKERNILTFNCKKKADYIGALQDDDSDKANSNAFHVTMQTFGQQIAKVKDLQAKADDMNEKLEDKISMLEAKADKEKEDYELLIKLLKIQVKMSALNVKI